MSGGASFIAKFGGIILSKNNLKITKTKPKNNHENGGCFDHLEALYSDISQSDYRQKSHQVPA